MIEQSVNLKLIIFPVFTAYYIIELLPPQKQAKGGYCCFPKVLNLKWMEVNNTRYISIWMKMRTSFNFQNGANGMTYILISRRQAQLP